MAVLDLQLQAAAANEALTAFLITPNGQESFIAPWPATPLEWQQEWRRQFVAHHDPAGAPVSRDAVRSFSDKLERSLSTWLEGAACAPLQRALLDLPDIPLRVRLEGAASAPLADLPWERLAPERPVWRLIPRTVQHSPRPQRARRPRVLLVVGDETGLSLDAELLQLQSLANRGRLELEQLRGDSSNLQVLRQSLLNARGWDALIFFGHSEADPNGGGRLHLGDGSWVGTAAFQMELSRAAANGLALALFNSCSGLDLSSSCVAAGIDWALCFREPVPCHAASLAFTALLGAMERGEALWSAVRLARQALRSDKSAVGADLLLSLVAGPNARPYQLPLRKRKQFLLRLSRSTPSQTIASLAMIAMAAAAEINPANPFSAYLLDRRLFVQRIWRDVTHQQQIPRSIAPLPVLILNQRSAAEVGAVATSGRVSRDLLARVLLLSPPSQTHRIGLDLVLDEQAPFSNELAAVIRKQQREMVFAGFYGQNVDARSSGETSKPLSVLQAAGLQSRNLTTGTPAIAGELKWVPLQLWAGLDRSSFAGTAATELAIVMPADSVIDWSLDWRRLLRRIELRDLPSLKAQTLIVGTDGSLDRDDDDLFSAPGAMDPELVKVWQGDQYRIPGVVVQAVLAQGLNLRHWLTPASQTMTTALAAGLGVLIAACLSDRRRRVGLVVLLTVVSLPLLWQAAVGWLLLVPIALPLSALSLTAFSRRE